MIKHIMVATALWFATAAVFPLYAQQHNKPTLGSLWPKVKENYPGVGSKTSAIDAAEYNEQAVKSGMLPQVKAQAQNTYGTYQGSAGAFFPQAGFFNVNGATDPLDRHAMAANSFGSATVEWELYAFGKRRAENMAANALTGKAVSEKEAYLLSLKKILSDRYISLLYNDAKLNWTKKNAERLDDIRSITSGLSAAGLRPAADSLLASSAYVQAIGEHDKWSGLAKAAFIKLLELYGADTVDYAVSADRFSNPPEKYPTGNTVNPA
ncbi:MAG TPA: TolC family protein, partial [Cyclobacteriaceae bacterium]|nr:TolC family protein [Cyclobacteriaceae bacterium]